MSLADSRGIQQASELQVVQKKLGCSRASLGPLSEAGSVFDADRLKEIIACTLIRLWTGRKPTKRTYAMICLYFCGLTSEDEWLAHLATLKRQDEAASKKS